jgi:hypothetical protein
VKTLRNLCIGVAAAVLGIGAASAQETAKPADKPAAKSEQSHRHGGNRGDHGCRHQGGERHEHQKDQKDQKHEHERR